MLEVDRILDDAEKMDLLTSGKFFAYVYETGDEELKAVAMRALQRFYNKNMLDFTVYRSAIFFEKEVLGFSKKLLHGEDTCGTFTYGGTESIMLAVLSARNSFWKRRGKSEIPKVLAPYTIHPSFAKSAHYLGMDIKYFGVDGRLKADVESLKESIDERTALIAISAPNWPFGTLDPVKEIAEVAMDKKTLLHVDACLGGFILPFFEKLGEKVEPFDFRVEGYFDLRRSPQIRLRTKGGFGCAISFNGIEEGLDVRRRSKSRIHLCEPRSPFLAIRRSLGFCVCCSQVSGRRWVPKAF